MFVPNAMLARLIRGIVADSPGQVTRIRAVSRAGAVGAAAHAYHRQATSSRRPRGATAAPGDDAPAVLVEMKAVDAEMMVRAMIAAAAADGEIDGGERGRILRYLRNAGGTPEEHAFAEAEMLRPADPEELARDVTGREAAAEIYAAALLATEAATPGGRSFLARLAHALALPADFVTELHASWSDPPPESLGPPTSGPEAAG